MSKLPPPPLDPSINDNLTDSTIESSSSTRSGRKKGCVLERVNLRSGGMGGRERPETVDDHLPWNLEWKDGDDDDNESSDSEYTVSSDSEEEDEVPDDLGDEDEANCISDLEGNRLLPLGKVMNVMSNSMCCTKCAIQNHKVLMDEFIDFCSAYEEKMKREETELIFYSKVDRLQWRSDNSKSTKELYAMYNGSKRGGICTNDRLISRFNVSEQTMGCATSLFGFCGRKRRPHQFRVDADKIRVSIRSSFHHHSKGKMYAMNYQLAAAIQQMGCGPADVSTLCGFLSLPISSVQYHVKRAEQVMGPIQLLNKECSQREAVVKEIAAHQINETDGLKYHACDTEGHKHDRLPLLKGSYGNY